jgi:flavodoxin I
LNIISRKSSEMFRVHTSVFFIVLHHLTSIGEAWTIVPLGFHPSKSCRSTPIALDGTVGIVYGTSTGNTLDCVEKIYKTFGPDLASEPIDIDTLDAKRAAKVFEEHKSLIVGAPTWNTASDSERSGTGWDNLYGEVPSLESILKGKKIAVFGCGDQASYGDYFCDAVGELFDVFESAGCIMLGAWSMEGYDHVESKTTRGDKFCGLLLDQDNQDDLTDERVEIWVSQLKQEGLLV